MDAYLLGWVVLGVAIGLLAPITVAAVALAAMLGAALVLGVMKVEDPSRRVRPLPLLAAGIAVLVVGLMRELGPVAGIAVAVGIVLVAVVIGADMG
jgi:hypothetical protein